MKTIDIQVTYVPASQLEPEQIDRWRDLHRNCVSPNIYLSPDFVLTALDTFCKENPMVLGITGGTQLFGLAILQENERSLAFPMRSVKLFKTIHSFQTGILLRKGITNEMVDTLLRELFDRGAPAVSCVDFDMRTPAAQTLIASAKRQRLYWYELVRYSRPILESDISLEEWQSTRKKAIKEAARQRRRLAEQGDVGWRLVMPADVTSETVETFLSLEHDGWKAERGTSLLSREAESEFLRRLVPKLADAGEIFFTELRLNRDVVASTINFMSGEAAFAFKVGWDRRLARFGPGVLNEISFVEHVAGNELPFKHIESGAQEDSFIARLWPGRTTMFTGYLIRGHVGKISASTTQAARRLRARLSK